MSMTVVSVDLVEYSKLVPGIAALRGAKSVKDLDDQIQEFIDEGILASDAKRRPSKVPTGDGAFVVFHEASDAHRFAMALEQATRRHNETCPYGLNEAQRHFRMGAATGELSIETSRTGQLSISGLAMTQSTRLQTQSNPDEILIAPDTYRALPAEFQRLYGPQERVKGKPHDEKFEARRCRLGHIDPLPPPTAKARVAILYRRDAQPDEDILRLIEAHLVGRGYSVFIDKNMAIGVEWAKEIDREIRSMDAVIPLLSAASVHSEMLAYEVELAQEEAQKRGRPFLFPVRVKYEDALPPSLAVRLDRYQYFLWRDAQDTEHLLSRLIGSLHSPNPPKEIPEPGGAMPPDSMTYVARPSDDMLRTALENRNMIVLVKGARQMGKTSLLARGLRQSHESEARTIFTDLQKLNNDDFKSPGAFLLSMARWIRAQLKLDDDPRRTWDHEQGANINFENFLIDCVLTRIDQRVIWWLDEVDRLFPCGFGGEIFGLFRSWFNDRAIYPSRPWSRLTMVITYATESHLFITDVNQSPFNVGTRIELQDFTQAEVAELNRRYGSPLRSDADLARYYGLLGGQPYLVNRGLYEMATRGLPLDGLEAQSHRDEGIFGDHLKRILVLLAREPVLCEVVRGVLRGRACPTPESFYRLRSAGIIAGDAASAASMRCNLYAIYLERHLR
jgi:class 3 adenylate cyclase